jgi:hypothetical protein
MPFIHPYDGQGEIKGVIRHDPVGNLEELKANGLPKSQYASCSMRVRMPDGKFENVGCPMRERCERLEKDGEGKPRGDRKITTGPLNLGIRWIKQTPNGKQVVVFADSCMNLADKKADWEHRGIVDVIAVEGETIEWRGSDHRDETVPGEGIKRFIDDKLDKPYLIPFFPRPDQNKTLASEVFANKQVANEMARRKDAAREQALGVTQANKAK